MPHTTAPPLRTATVYEMTYTTAKAKQLMGPDIGVG